MGVSLVPGRRLVHEPGDAVQVLQGAILFITVGAEVLARYRVRWSPRREEPAPLAEETT